MDTRLYDVIDPSFISDLKESDAVVDLGVLWLKKFGWKAIKNPLRIRDTVKDLSNWEDSGDICLERGRGQERVEVKKRNFNFSSSADYPYPSVIVDVCHTWDRAAIKPVAYLIFSADLKSVAIVRGSTSVGWSVFETYDKKKQRSRRFYVVPKNLVSFEKTDSLAVGQAEDL